MDLTPEQIRVLGCLLEKERTTPDAYPLSLNGLVSACNQTTNRDPVVRYRDDEIEQALDGLRAHELARRGVYPGSRVIKYRHCLDEVLELGRPEQAVLTVILLRGPQTPGELKSRTERLHPFSDLVAVEAALAGLAGRDEPLVERRVREPGRKEARWDHRLGAGVPSAGPQSGRDEQATSAPPVPPDPDLSGVRSDVRNDMEARVTALESAVAELRERLDR